MNLKFRIKRTISYFYPFLLEQVKGDISPYLEVVLSKGRILLNASKCNYSYGKSCELFDQVFRKIRIQDRTVKNTLVLGFGCGEIASLLLEKYRKESFIIGIEKDAIVMKLASKYFNTTRFKTLRIFSDDAYDYVNGSNERFDLIIMDVSVEDYLPRQFHEKRFIKSMESLLEEKGILIFSKSAKTTQQEKELDILRRHFSELEGYSHLYHFPQIEKDKYFIVYAKSGFIATPLLTASRNIKAQTPFPFVEKQGAFA